MESINGQEGPRVTGDFVEINPLLLRYLKVLADGLWGAVLTVLCMGWMTAAAAEERYALQDQGDFAPTGHLVEFADRFKWRSYEIKFEFGFDDAARRISNDSVLTLSITKRDGGHWEYRCRKSKGGMYSNINFLYGKGALIFVECRIRPDKFARAVDMEEDLVGQPTLVFEALIKDGKAVPGMRKGIYVLVAGQIEAGLMNQYAKRYSDPSDLSVLFASQSPYLAHPYIQPGPRFIH